MKVYIVCVVIDGETSVEAAYTDADKAQQRCEEIVGECAADSDNYAFVQDLVLSN